MKIVTFPFKSTLCILTFCIFNSSSADEKDGTCFPSFSSNISENSNLIIFDLDDDGIEIIDNDEKNYFYFEFHLKGIKNKTDWLSPDDGFLVLDRNNNGVIDNATELFGNTTLLNNNETASTGFFALEQEDSNRDGIINNSDSNFAILQIWRDLNQDSISQGNELFSLPSLGITQIFTSPNHNSQQELKNNDHLIAVGDYHRNNITNIGHIAEVNFRQSFFRVHFSDTISLTEPAKTFPKIHGTGRLRDIEEAASLSEDLSTELQQYLNIPDQEDRKKQLDKIIKTWAQTSNMETTVSSMVYENKPIKVLLPDPSLSENDFLDIVDILERFMGVRFRNFYFSLNSSQTTPICSLEVSVEQYAFIMERYKILKDFLYTSFARQTYLSAYYNAIFIDLQSQEDVLDFHTTKSLFEQRQKSYPKQTLIELHEFHQYMGHTLESIGWEKLSLITKWVNNKTNTVDFSPLLLQLGYNKKTDGNDTIIGTNNNDTLDGGLGADGFSGGLGDDSYYVDNIADVIREENNEGDDTIFSTVSYTLPENVETLTLAASNSDNLSVTGNNENNKLYGNNRDNTIIGKAGNDLLDGKKGNDILIGDEGHDDYQFGRKYGVDTIDENDSSQDKMDRVQFLDGIKSTQLWFKHPDSSNDLEISIIGSQDRLIIKDWYLAKRNHIELFQTLDDSRQLSDIHVEKLVEAMANLVQANGEQMPLPGSISYLSAFVPVIETSWIPTENKSFEGMMAVLIRITLIITTALLVYRKNK